MPLESHSRTAEQFAAIAFSGQTAVVEPNTVTPPSLGYSAASSRRTRGALVPSAIAETPHTAASAKNCRVLSLTASEGSPKSPFMKPIANSAIPRAWLVSRASTVAVVESAVTVIDELLTAAGRG